MLKRLTLKSAGLVGISVQPENIHLIQLKKAKKSYSLVRARQISIPKNIYVEGKVRDFAALSAVLADVVESERLQAYQAAISVPANQVKMAHLLMPAALTDADVTAEIAAEVYRGLPSKNETLAIDFERGDQSGGADARIFFAAARGDYIAQYAACLKQAGLALAVVDIDVFALLRAVRHALQYAVPVNEKMAALYFGHDYAVLVGQHESDIIFYQQWEGQHAPASSMTVMQWLEWCCQTHLHRQVMHVAIGGKLESVYQAAKIMRAHWKCKIYETDPFAHMAGVVVADKVTANTDRSAFLLACGLAMRESLPWLK